MSKPSLNNVLKGDLGIWLILFVLCIISLVEVYTSSSNMTYKTGQFWAPVVSHSGMLALALIAAWITHQCNLTIIKGSILCLYPISLIMLVLVRSSGEAINGAHRYVSLFGVSFQPSELAKLALVGVAALLLSAGYDKKRNVTDKRFFWALVGATLLMFIPTGLENLSTALIMGLTVVILTWMTNPPSKPFYGLCCGLVGLGLIGIFAAKTVPTEAIEKYAPPRATTWVNRIKHSGERPADPKEYDIYENVQKTHARIAIASSGITGVGFGKSVERDFLPQAYSDFIYAIIIEEGGLVWGIIVMGLYLALLALTLMTVRRCKNRFQACLALGLAVMMTVQAMVNMAVATGAIPVTGQPLPLISRGGTSLIICGIYIGIILRVSYAVQKKEKNEKTA